MCLSSYMFHINFICMLMLTVYQTKEFLILQLRNWGQERISDFPNLYRRFMTKLGIKLGSSVFQISAFITRSAFTLVYLYKISFIITLAFVWLSKF